MKRLLRSGGAAAAAGVMIAVVGMLAVTGRWPGSSSIQRFAPAGILDLPAERVARIDIVDPGGGALTFDRKGTGWVVDGTAVPATPDTTAIAARIETGLRLLTVSSPVRTLRSSDQDNVDMATFGLDPPRRLVSLTAADSATATVAFGAANPAQTSQYVRVIGRAAVYLMPRHVGAEWDLAADMAHRAAPAVTSSAARSRDAGSPRFLVPVSMARIWSVEIVAGGGLRRFERDDAGDWFLHVGQHVHIGPADAHVADPDRAPVIAAELDAFGQTPVERLIARDPASDELAHYGLARPQTIVLLYARDDSRPVARIDLGDAASDGFTRLALVRETATLVAVPDYAAAHLAKLLKIAGPSS
ncbi:MAG TPA: DUF4340 domain-containing protein [Stellaceae bacterium]